MKYGVTSAERKRNQKGGKILFAFAALVLIVILIIWMFIDPWGNDPKENNESIDNPSDKESVIPVKKGTDNNIPFKKTIIKSSLSPIQLAETEANYQKAKDLFEKDEFVKARDTAKLVINSGLKQNEKLWIKAADIIGKSNIAIFMSDIPSNEKERYTIKSGDNLSKIAERFGTTVEAIQKSNKMSPGNSLIFPGKTLYIYSGVWNIKVNKNQFRLYLYNGKELFKFYRIGIGRQGRTPSGTFKITVKDKEPDWTFEGRTIKYGAKENVLGTRWMALQPTGTTDTTLKGYGIHGTWEPKTIGTESSNGCIRMKNEDVNELYTILPYFTKVTIED